MTALPWNISGSASPLFFQNKQSAHYRALIAISDLPHPDRSVLGAFIEDALNPEEAAQYFLSTTCAGNIYGVPPKKTISQFLSEWKILVDKCEWTASEIPIASNLRFSSANTSLLTLH